MRRALIAAIGTLAVAASVFTAAQQRQPAPPTFPWAGQDAAIPTPKAAPPPPAAFNARDFTGVWLRQGRVQMLTDAPPPKMTAAGDAMFRKSIVANPNELQKEAPPPIKGNDPIMKCDPWGFPRILWDFAAPMEFVVTPTKIIQFFEWTHVWRDIWIDGRPLPKDPDPRWMGYSVGRWEGDTLVVETVGMDERAWLDENGHRKSANARFLERYRRINATTIQYDATLTDPEYYTVPWVGDTRQLKLLPMEGWPQAELREEFCAPSVEQDFIDTIRDPAGGKVK